MRKLAYVDDERESQRAKTSPSADTMPGCNPDIRTSDRSGRRLRRPRGPMRSTQMVGTTIYNPPHLRVLLMICGRGRSRVGKGAVARR